MEFISRKAAIDRLNAIPPGNWSKARYTRELFNVPSVPAVPLDKLAAMLSTIGATINCYYCREVLGECTKPPEEREYECDSMAHWIAFLNGWRKKMEEQDESN